MQEKLFDHLIIRSEGGYKLKTRDYSTKKSMVKRQLISGMELDLGIRKLSGLWNGFNSTIQLLTYCWLMKMTEG